MLFLPLIINRAVFFSYKDRVPKNLKSLVLYKFTCRNCKNFFYWKVNSTFPSLDFVSYEQPHTYNSKNATTIREHTHHHNHPGTSAYLKIIGSTKNDYHLKIKESLNIIRGKPELNKTVRSFPLYLFQAYASISCIIIFRTFIYYLVFLHLFTMCNLNFFCINVMS